MGPLISGIGTGMFLQLALGPVFFYVAGITLDSSYTNSFSGILAVTLADYMYIVLSLMGIGRLLQKERIKEIFGLASSIILLLFGVMICYKGLVFIRDAGQAHLEWTVVNSFTSCFILTLSSPLTIVFWSSVFSAKAIEKNYKKRQLVIFGLGTGLSTLLFLSAAMLLLSLLRSTIPDHAVQISNCIVGIVLIYYGIIRAVKNLKK